jgi:hypothetical protein
MNVLTLTFNRASAAARSESRCGAVGLTASMMQGPPCPVKGLGSFGQAETVRVVGKCGSLNRLLIVQPFRQGEASAARSLKAISLTCFRPCRGTNNNRRK